MNKKIFLLTLILSVVALFNFCSILPVMACDNDWLCEAGEDYNNCPQDCSKPISEVLEDAIDWLLTVASIISILVIVIGGIVYVSSSGNPETAKTAKNIVNGGVLGVIICGLAYGILAVIHKVLTT